MMKYNPEYIHFENTNDLIDKWCIASDSVCDIKYILGEDNNFIKGQLVQIKAINNNKSFPFKVTCHDKDEPEVTEILMKFVYVDPEFQIMIHDEKVLEWTDLKIGDIIRSKSNRNIFIQVQGIDKSDNTSEHIFAKDDWLSNDDLADWEKVED